MTCLLLDLFEDAVNVGLGADHETGDLFTYQQRPRHGPS